MKHALKIALALLIAHKMPKLFRMGMLFQMTKGRMNRM